MDCINWLTSLASYLSSYHFFPLFLHTSCHNPSFCIICLFFSVLLMIGSEKLTRKKEELAICCLNSYFILCNWNYFLCLKYCLSFDYWYIMKCLIYKIPVYRSGLFNLTWLIWFRSAKTKSEWGIQVSGEISSDVFWWG